MVLVYSTTSGRPFHGHPATSKEGVLHHVMARGIERTKIFRNRKDREDFLSRLEEIAQAGAWVVYSWALMPNHIQALLPTEWVVFKI